jgi:hypothetical protein
MERLAANITVNIVDNFSVNIVASLQLICCNNFTMQMYFKQRLMMNKYSF